jgi:L-fucose mutarotase/ribose pyranase (RbsD/FucU family)
MTKYRYSTIVLDSVERKTSITIETDETDKETIMEIARAKLYKREHKAYPLKKGEKLTKIN